ncbi:MAG: Uma2 family endonuclease [Blastocatellia bacterium]|nr:Uma2 family endonuclease [Blastocatellia bacterium]
MTAPPKKKYTLEEYLELDRNSEERYEYFDGDVFAMAGGSPSHARISGNAYSELQSKLRGGRCEAFNSEMRIKVPLALPYRLTAIACISKCAPRSSVPDPRNARAGKSFLK